MRFLSPAPFRTCFVLLTLLFGVPLASQLATAQAPPPNRKAPPPPPPPSATDQQQFLSYWTTETGWHTELQLRNNQGGQNLTVIPVFRTPDGTETPLSPVIVQPQEVKTVDLATAIGSSVPQLVGTYGSLALRYRTPNQVNLYAVSMVSDVGHSIAFHIDATGEDQTESVGSREGIWWLPNGTVNDYLVLLNQGQNPLQLSLSLFDASGKAFVQSLTIPPRGMNRLSIRQLVAAAGLVGSYGGIKVSAANHAGSLDTLHVLFDENAGFSAVMKMFDYDPRAQLKERDYAGTGQWTLRAPMLALSSPDPALAFPPGTILQPQLFVRNTTPKPIDASLTLNWRGDSTVGKAQGPALRLAPYETRRIDIAALQDSKTLPQNAQWASVILTTNGLPDEVVAVAASYDQSLRFGAQTPFSDQLAAHWAGGQWQYDPQHDSIITAGNGGTKPTQAAFTLFYNQGAQKYQLVQTLQPGEQMWMDIGKLIREHVADKTGKTLPAGLDSGSYEVRDLTNKGVGTLFEGKVIYDRTYGHVTYGCAACCGWTDPVSLWYDPINIFYQGIADDGVLAWYPCESQYDDVSSVFYNNWSSGNTGIVTVNAYGTHTGVSVGSTTSQTHGLLQTNNPHIHCPTSGKTPSSGANTTPTVTIDSFSPNPIVGGSTASVHITVNPAATINLVISRSGTGTATFGAGGNTTLQISGTTTVTITAGAESNGSADLTLSASYASNLLTTYLFSVTTGACTSAWTGSVGSGAPPCPKDITLTDNYNMTEYCSTCQVSCVPVNYDSAFTNAHCSGGSLGGILGAGNQTFQVIAAAHFAPNDCNHHKFQIKTTVTDAQGVPTDYLGYNFDLKCNSNGSPSCQ